MRATFLHLVSELPEKSPGEPGASAPGYAEVWQTPERKIAPDVRQSGGSRPRLANVRSIAVAVAVVLLSGCGKHTPTGPEQAEQKPKVARSEVERGPVRLSVVVDPSPARLSDEPKLTLRVEYPQGIIVAKPQLGTALGEFVIRDFREPLPRVQDDRQIIEQIYTLEPPRPGKTVIEPIAITFVDQRPKGSGKQLTLQTEAITVEVTAAVSQQAPSLAQLRGPADPVPLPQPPLLNTYRWLALLVCGLIAGAGAVWWLRRRRVAQAGPVLTPSELAYLELQQLLDNEAAREDAKLFYVELTAIVRRYIERTTAIHAPEQTTQEFLHEISRRSDFPVAEAQRLKNFLEAADLVKFAALEPRKEDIEESFRRARMFVGCAGGEEAAA